MQNIFERFGRRNSQTLERVELASFSFHVYFVEEPKEFNKERQDSLLSKIRLAILNDFSEEVNALFSGQVVAEVRRLEWGSVFGTVSLILSAGVSIYEFIAQYDDFINSLQRLRMALDAAIENALRAPGGISMGRASVSVGTPVIRPIERYMQRFNENKGKLPMFYSPAFFYYLLIMHFIMLSIIGALVYIAVRNTYFGLP